MIGAQIGSESCHSVICSRGSLILSVLGFKKLNHSWLVWTQRKPSGISSCEEDHSPVRVTEISKPRRAGQNHPACLKICRSGKSEFLQPQQNAKMKTGFKPRITHSISLSFFALAAFLRSKKTPAKQRGRIGKRGCGLIRRVCSSVSE